MGWINWENVLAVAAAPFTAGASLAFLQNDHGDTVLDYVTGAKSARDQEKRQKQYQDETNQLTINLANTAHQREVADLQAAGLNPVLSAGGNGAATPQLGTATAVNEMPGGLMSQAAQAAQIYNMTGSAKQALANAKLQNTQEKLQPAIAKSEIDRNQAETNKMMADTGYTKSQIEFYNKHGVFPGATVKGGALGVNADIPVGLKIPTSGRQANSTNKNNKWEKYQNYDFSTNARKQLEAEY